MTNQTFYLEAHTPYDRPEHLFSGSEQEMRTYINANKGWKEWKGISGKVHRYKTICGYALDALEVSIVGPDIRDFLED